MSRKVSPMHLEDNITKSTLFPLDLQFVEDPYTMACLSDHHRRWLKQLMRKLCTDGRSHGEAGEVAGRLPPAPRLLSDCQLFAAASSLISRLYLKAA